MNLRYFGATDPGLQRDKNEDAYLAEGGLGLFAVADGLGGLPKGELASQLVVEALMQDPPRGLDQRGARDLCNALSEHVRREGLRIAGIDGIATTLTLALLRGKHLQVAHVGDSAAFLMGGGEARRLTQDQTVAERMRATGAVNVPEYYEHVLTQCIGQEDDLTPEFIEVELSEGDKLLLCSDGLTKTVTDEEIFDILQTLDDPRLLAKRLVAEANDRGGPDNCTVVAVFC